MENLYEAIKIYLKKAYGLDPGDMNISENDIICLDKGETVENFVDGLAEDYDLEKLINPWTGKLYSDEQKEE